MSNTHLSGFQSVCERSMAASDPNEKQKYCCPGNYFEEPEIDWARMVQEAEGTPPEPRLMIRDLLFERISSKAVLQGFG